ncbi:MAG: DUF1573 domain-containing protein [Planctomycetia bacterium]
MHSISQRARTLFLMACLLAGGIASGSQDKKPHPTPLPSPLPSPDPSQEPPDPNSKARITWEQGSDTKVFGKALQGDVLKHRFQLKSSGEADLIIRQAKPTCGCTMAQIYAEQPDGTMAPYVFGNPIPSGRKVEIGATLHTEHKRGPVSSRINISTNDPRGQVSLGLEAEVEVFFQINPNVINFNTISSKDQVTDKLAISVTRGDRLRLNLVREFIPPSLRVELVPLDPDAEGKASRYELVATLGPGLVEGPFAATIPLRSDLVIPGGEKLPNGKLPTYETSVSILAKVTGSISFDPAFVSLGLIKPGQALTRTIRVKCHDPAYKLGDIPIEVQGRDTPAWEYAKCFSSSVRPVQGENSVDVEVRLNGMPPSLNGSFAGNLVIKVGHPEKPELRLPISGMCRGGSAPQVDPAGGQTPPK